MLIYNYNLVHTAIGKQGMEFIVKSGNAEKQRGACIVVGLFEPRRLTPVADHLDQVSNGYISNIARRGDLEGKCGQMLLLHNVPNIVSDRLLLVGCGRERELGDSQYRRIISNIINILNETGSMEAIFYVTDLPVRGRDMHWKIREAVLAAYDTLYRFDQLKTSADQTRRPLRKIILHVPKRRDLNDGEMALRQGIAIGNGLNLCKDLGNLPANICTPAYLAEQAQSINERNKKMHCEVMGPAAMQELDMGALLSVAKGSRQEARFIILRYQGEAAKTPPIALVGKGITFDSGGISIKPAQDMDQMKFDMCGAAAVIATLQVAAELDLPLNVVGVVAASENLPDGQANKPGDIVTSMSGQTIEILNTDAEGRLVLCDALTYVQRFKPSVIIDVATLTGACIVALGNYASGLFSNHGPLSHDLQNAGKTIGDAVWPLPLWDEYQEKLNSNFADMANVGGREAGAVTAACFLNRFVQKHDHWAHLDIAGTAWLTGEKKGATGRPVPLLSQYLLDISELARKNKP